MARNQDPVRVGLVAGRFVKVAVGYLALGVKGVDDMLDERLIGKRVIFLTKH